MLLVQLELIATRIVFDGHVGPVLAVEKLDPGPIFSLHSSVNYTHYNYVVKRCLIPQMCNALAYDIIIATDELSFREQEYISFTCSTIAGLCKVHFKIVTNIARNKLLGFMHAGNGFLLVHSLHAYYCES